MTFKLPVLILTLIIFAYCKLTLYGFGENFSWTHAERGRTIIDWFLLQVTKLTATSKYLDAVVFYNKNFQKYTHFFKGLSDSCTKDEFFQFISNSRKKRKYYSLLLHNCRNILQYLTYVESFISTYDLRQYLT